MLSEQDFRRAGKLAPKAARSRRPNMYDAGKAGEKNGQKMEEKKKKERRSLIPGM